MDPIRRWIFLESEMRKQPSHGGIAIVLGGDGSIPQTSLPPFSAPEPPPTILWEALVDFSKDGGKGALGNKHCSKTLQSAQK